MYNYMKNKKVNSNSLFHKAMNFEGILSYMAKSLFCHIRENKKKEVKKDERRF